MWRTEMPKSVISTATRALVTAPFGIEVACSNVGGGSAAGGAAGSFGDSFGGRLGDTLDNAEAAAWPFSPESCGGRAR